MIRQSLRRCSELFSSLRAGIIAGLAIIISTSFGAMPAAAQVPIHAKSIAAIAVGHPDIGQIGVMPIGRFVDASTPLDITLTRHFSGPGLIVTGTSFGQTARITYSRTPMSGSPIFAAVLDLGSAPNHRWLGDDNPRKVVIA